MRVSGVVAAALVCILSVSRPALGDAHLDLTAKVEPAARTLDVHAVITTRSAQLVFYLASNAVVESIGVDGATAPASRSTLGSLTRYSIELPGEDAESTAEVRYHASLETLDTSMTHDDTLAALPAMSSQAGAYLPGNSGWHPVLESPFSYRLNTSVPAGYVAVAPGRPPMRSRRRPTALRNSQWTCRSTAST